jgi:hypothetical protein
MGLTNNEVAKGFVDVLTWLVEGINKIIDAISNGSGGMKMFVSLLTSIGTIAAGGKLLNAFGLKIGGIFELFKLDKLIDENNIFKKGAKVGGKFLDGLKSTFMGAS